MKKYFATRYVPYDYTKTVDCKIKTYIEFSIMNNQTDNTIKNYLKKQFGLSGEMAKSYIMIMRGYINGIV
jgi:hypothetical protein